MFRGTNDFPDIVQFKSLLASVGVAVDSTHISEVPICILSTGDELTKPGRNMSLFSGRNMIKSRCFLILILFYAGEPLKPGRIYDSNTTMLQALLQQHGFHKITTLTLSDT